MNKDKEPNQLIDYVKKKNKSYTVLIIICALLLLCLLVLSNKWSDEMNKYISFGLGIIGATLLGITTFHSSKTISSLSATYWGYSLQKADSLLSTKLLSAIGTMLILTSLII